MDDDEEGTSFLWRYLMSVKRGRIERMAGDFVIITVSLSPANFAPLPLIRKFNTIFVSIEVWVCVCFN